MSMQSSSAYSYDIAALQPKVKQPPELKVVKNRQFADNRAVLKAFGVFAVSLLVIAVMLYNNVILTELNDEIDYYQEQYEVLKSENRRMEVELEGKISLRNIEEKATQDLGMARMESYQVEYVDLSEGDKVTVASPAQEGIFSRLSDAFGSFLEYLGL